MAKKEIIDNNRVMLECIREWVRPVKSHDTPIILVSGGKVDIDGMKKLLAEKPNTKIMCVKHALPVLAENNIKPWACVILDTRSINEFSSLGKSRVDLIKSAPSDTIFFALARVHPSYFFVLQELNARVIGFNNHFDEIAQSFNIPLNDFVKSAEHGELYNEIYQSTSQLPGSCAAVCSINLAILLGFREMHLFGYDANVKSPEDTKDKCYEVETNGKMYYVPEEFTSLGLEFETIFKIYPQQLNVQFYHYSPDSFIGGIFQSIQQPKLDTLENTLNNLKPVPEKYVKILENIQTNYVGYYNKRVYNEGYTIIPFKTHQEYSFLQNKNAKVKCNVVYNLKNNMKQIVDYFVSCFQSQSQPSSNISHVKGLCHGVGLGYEMLWLREFFSEVMKTNNDTKTDDETIDIIGTDIAKDTIRKQSKFVQHYDKVLEQDFSETPPEWCENFDFIYSNSLECATHPIQTIEQWMGCLKEGGLCFIDMPNIEKPYSTLFKPFSCMVESMKKILNTNYCIVNVLDLGEIQSSDLAKKACVGKMEKCVCFVVKNK